MRIAIDASRATVARTTGTEYYARELIRAIIRQNPSHHLTLYFRDTPPPDLFPASPWVTLRVLPFARMWTHVRFAAALWADRPAVTFVPAHTLPFIFPGRAVVTVHDLGYKVFPEAHRALSRYYLDQTTRFSARRSTLILADSQATLNDLGRYYGTAEARIRRVYPGVDAPVIGDVATMRARYGLPDRYFLFIGTLQPRKNIARIVQAYARWRQTAPDDPAALVLAGARGWLYEDSWTRDVPGVLETGYVAAEDKGALYAGALGLVFPTLYEGFGFPVLEAMHSGTPVIASRTSSLPELVGEAGLLVDPLSVEDIAHAIGHLAGSADLRQRLAALGRLQAARFTWEQAARGALDALEEAAAGSPTGFTDPR